MIEGLNAMNFKSFKELVDRTKSEHPIWFGMEPDQSPNDKDLDSAEEKLEAKLPVDYKNFICEFGGGYFAFANIYSLEKGSAWNLIDVNYRYEALRKGFVLISENGVGDFYGFKVVNNECKPEVYFYDHEEESWRESKHRNIFEYLKEVALTN